MQKDFQNFIACKSIENARKVLKHSGKISAECIYGQELQEALLIVGE